MSRVPRINWSASARRERALLAIGVALLVIALALVWIPAAVAGAGLACLYAGLFIDLDPSRRTKP